MRKAAGQVAVDLVIRVAESLLIAFVVGGVLLWGYTQTVGVKVEYIITKMEKMDEKLINACESLNGHLAAHQEREKIFDRRDVHRRP